MGEKRKAELLAPAGSYESMEAAFAAGADAVYIGGSRFGARAYAENPDEEMLCHAIDYAHLHGRRLYLTVNTLLKEQELKELYSYLFPYYQRGLDGVIVQDLGAMALMRKYFPDLPLHASTQMNITSVYGARKLKELGASRIVTARELSLEEIRQIHEQVDIELESFIHGALCYSYSGQCLMSSLIGGRSGNRGRCAQPCRLPYEVLQNEQQQYKYPKNKKRKNENLWNEASKNNHQQKEKKLNLQQNRYYLNMKDLCTLDMLPDILEAGVDSLKIEGRMKSPRYTAGVVSIYRKYLDHYLQYGKKGYKIRQEDKQCLLDLFDRGGFTDGYYSRHNGKDMLALTEKPAFREGNQPFFDELDQKFVKKKLQEPVSGFVDLEPGKAAKLILSKKTSANSTKQEKTNPKTTEQIKAGPEVKELGKTSEKAAEPEICVTICGLVVEEAKKRPITKEEIEKQLRKTGNSPFYFTDLTVSAAENSFLPVQALNELRRTGLEALEQQILSGYVRGQSGNTEGKDGQCDNSRWKNVEDNAGPCNEHSLSVSTSPPCLTVSVEEQNQFFPVLDCPEVEEIYIDADGFAPESWSSTVLACHKKQKKCRLLMPAIFRQEGIAYMEHNRHLLAEAGFDGLVVRNLEEVEWQKEQEKAFAGYPHFLIVFDASLYTWNRLAQQAMMFFGAERTTFPAELNHWELKELVHVPGQKELVVYGRLPMMVSAQCIQKTAGGCIRKREVLLLKDRTGKHMPVKNHCRFCYNTIYNASPLSLLDQENLIKELSPAAIRLQFTTETPEEVRVLLDTFASHFLRGCPAVFPFSDYTRGHSRRGVE